MPESRYLLCAIVGDGLTPETSFRSAAKAKTNPATGGPAYTVRDFLPPAGPDGQPTRPVCLALATGDDWTLIEGDPDIDDLTEPAVKAVRIGALPAARRAAALSRATARGLDVSAYDGETQVATMVEGIGKQINPDFDLRKFTPPQG